MICRRCHRLSDDSLFDELEEKINAGHAENNGGEGTADDGDNDGGKRLDIRNYCPFCGLSFTDETEIEVENPDAASSGSRQRDNIPDPTQSSYTHYDASYSTYTAPRGGGIPPYIPPVEPELTPTKKFLRAISHAAIYYLLFMAIQFIVASIYYTVVMYGATAEFVQEYYLDHGITDSVMSNDLYEQLTSELQAQLEVVVNNAFSEIDTNVVAVASYAATLFALLLIFKTRRLSFANETGIRKFSLPRLLPVIPAAIALQFIILFALNVIPIPQNLIESYTQLYSYIGKSSLLLEVISVVILAPVVEELIFRGCVYSRLRRGMRAFPAAFICSAAFGVAHGHIISILYATLLGFVLCYLYEKFDSVLVPMLFHVAFNAANYIPLMRQESSAAEIYITVAVSVVVFVVSAAYIVKCRGADKEDGDTAKSENETK